MCFRDDPQMNDCLKDAIQNFLPKLSTEIRAFKFPMLDPYITEDANLNYTVAGAFAGQMSIYELTSYGMAKAVVQSVAANFTTKNTMRLTMDVWFPEIFTKGSYEGSNRVGFLPFQSGGPFRLNITDVSIKWKIKGKARKVKGVEYMQVRSFKFKPTQIGNLKLKLEGLFPSKELTKSTVKLINNNWEFFVEQLMPETRRFFEPEMANLANKVFMRIPYDRLFPKGNSSITLVTTK